jgi:hypothetical protein
MKMQSKSYRQANNKLVPSSSTTKNSSKSKIHMHKKTSEISFSYWSYDLQMKEGRVIYMISFLFVRDNPTSHEVALSFFN